MRLYDGQELLIVSFSLLIRAAHYACNLGLQWLARSLIAKYHSNRLPVTVHGTVSKVSDVDTIPSRCAVWNAYKKKVQRSTSIEQADT